MIVTHTYAPHHGAVYGAPCYRTWSQARCYTAPGGFGGWGTTDGREEDRRMIHEKFKDKKPEADETIVQAQ